MELMSLDVFFENINPQTSEDATTLYLETDFHEIAFKRGTTITANYPNNPSCKTIINLDETKKITKTSCACGSKQEICYHILALAMAIQNDELT